MDGVKLGLIRLKASSFEPIHMNGCKFTPPAGGFDMPGEERIAELREVRSRWIFLRSVPLDC
jgi:hypothetical protein